MGTSSPETALGGAGRAFPTTLWSEVRAAADPSVPEYRERLNRLLHSYWRPVYVFIRTAWRKPVEDAKDLTQAFFAHLLERDFLSRCRPERGSFRAYLKQALRFFLTDADRAAAARRSATPSFSLDAAPDELERLGPAAPEETPERAYDREWFRGLLDSAIGALRETLAMEGKGLYFDVFRTYVLDPQQGAPPPTYHETARRLDVSEVDVRNYLTRCRRTLREILRARILEYVESESEAERELAVFLKG